MLQGMLSEFKFKNRDAKISHIKGLIALPSIKARAYDPSEAYDRLDYIDHPEHGPGFVDEIISDQAIAVFFLRDEQERELPQRIFP